VGIIAVIAIGFVLQRLAFSLPHLILSIFLGNVFSPMIDWLRTYKIPLPIIIILILLIVAAALVGLSYVMYLGIDSVVQSAPKYEERINALMQNISGFINRSSESLYGKSVSFDWQEMLNFEKIGAVVYAVAGSFM